MNKDKPPPDEYYVNYAIAYQLYKDADIARDIARLVKPREEQNTNEQGQQTP
jgi:hypothetical protein